VSTIISRKNGEVMGFHRLMINGANGLSNQPMTIDGETYLLCNGEIYNHVELQKKYDIKCTNGSDCEIILHLYNKIGFEKTVQELDGEFAIILITPDKVYIARDPYGVRALYFARNNKLNLIGIASENKALYHLFQHKNISQFPPGCIAEWNKQERTYKIPEPYYNYTHQLYKELRPGGELEEECILKVRKLLINAVNKRIMCSRIDKTTNRLAIGAYLSGGFDSSAIAAILQKELPYRLETFSIGFKGSPDLHYARIVADYIGSNHTQVIITETQALNAIPDVIEAIESYDITTVRASTMMYLLSKHISEHTNIAVMFSGEGSDEASGSYRYFDNAPSDDEFHIESERLLKDLCYFDNLRADKSSAAWGLELRVPFLDLEFLDYYMTIPRCIKTQQGLEKYLLRKAVGNYLPEEVLYRPKEAMSDGVSGHNRSWSTIIQDEAKRHYNMEDGLASEKKLYKSFFDQNYKGCDHQIPYYWLPKWCGDIQDPSARVLSIYKK
jgi:asparagine synthase (glutamine-hydrolysing)